ncbi:MAG: hypothetical protein ACPG49_14675, partial [Chitinophagales bacterium]
LYLPYFASTITEPIEPVMSLEDMENMGIENIRIDTIYDDEELIDTSFMEGFDSDQMKEETPVGEDEVLEFEIDKDSIPDNIMDFLNKTGGKKNEEN